MLGTEADDPLPEGFCLNDYTPTFVRIAGVAEALPGGRDLQFELALTNDAYLRIMKKNEPASWGGQFPPFQSMAIYFAADYATDLFCIFERCPDQPERYYPPYGSQYKLNRDALVQIERLLGIAVGAKSVLLWVLIILVLAVSVAIGLSVKAFIASNERVLCIMRAVGYRLRHLCGLFLLEFALITAVAGLLFVILLVGFHVGLAPRLGAQLELEPAWLASSVTERLR